MGIRRSLLLDIQNRPWWRRIWVAQEASTTSSTTLVCGEKTAPYMKNFLFYDLLRSDPSKEALNAMSRICSPLPHLMLWEMARHAHNQGLAGPEVPDFLERLLSMTIELESTDPRDRIFGILGLSDECKSILPCPDYTKDLREIFTQVTKAFLSDTNSVRILSTACHENYASGIPSWVTDWSVRSSFLVGSKYDDKLYSMAGGSELYYRISDDDRELRIKGKRVHTVKTVPSGGITAFRPVEETRDIIHGFSLFRESYLRGMSLQEYPTGEDVEEVLRDVLSWGFGIPDPSKARLYFDNWRRIAFSERPSPDPDTGEERIEFDSASGPRFDSASHTFLCITAKGFLAAMPYATEPGDWIVYLADTRIPFVIRLIGDHYRLMGPCCVHGISSGETIAQNDTELEWFSIR